MEDEIRVNYKIVSDDIRRGQLLMELEALLAEHKDNYGIRKGLQLAIKAVCEALPSGMWTDPAIKPERGHKILLKLKRGDCPPEYITGCWSEVWDCYESCEQMMHPVPDKWIVGWRMIPE